MTSNFAIPIHVLHQNPFIRASLAAALRDHSDLEVVRIEGDTAYYVDTLAPAHGPRPVLVADYASSLRVADALGAQRGGSAMPRIIVVAGGDREWEVQQALARQVHGYLTADFSLESLLACVRAAHRGRRYLCPCAAARLAESVLFTPLTGRECDVLALVLEGFSNKAIARRLEISLGTTKAHMKSIFEKLSVASRTQAVAVAQRRGILAKPSAPKDMVAFPTSDHSGSLPGVRMTL